MIPPTQQTKPLGEIAKIKTGKLDANAKSKNGPYPFFTCSKEISKIDTYSYDCECILVAGNGDLNVKYYKGKFDVYQRTYIIELNGKTDLYMRYLYHFIDSYMDTLRSQTIGGVIQYIKMNNLTDIQIPIPDLATQKAIATKLDAIQELIDQKKQVIHKTDELAKAIFVDMFGDPVMNEKGWEVKKLGEVVDFYNGKAHEKVIDENGTYMLINSKFIATDGKTYKRTDEQLFPLIQGDIVMVMSDVPDGRALAKCFLVSEDDTYTLNQRICAFRSENFNTLFLFKLLNRHPYFLSFNNGNSQTNLRKEEILSCVLIVPPLPLQQQFADTISQLQQVQDDNKLALAKLEELFASTMQECFSTPLSS